MTFGQVVLPRDYLIFVDLDSSTLQSMLGIPVSFLIWYLNHHQYNQTGYKPLGIDEFQDFHLYPCQLYTFSAIKFFHRSNPSIITLILSICAS